jgi:hypothetical protein
VMVELLDRSAKPQMDMVGQSEYPLENFPCWHVISLREIVREISRSRFLVLLWK